MGGKKAQKKKNLLESKFASQEKGAACCLSGKMGNLIKEEEGTKEGDNKHSIWST